MPEQNFEHNKRFLRAEFIQAYFRPLMAREKYVMSASLKEAADRDDRTTNQKSGFAENFPRK